MPSLSSISIPENPQILGNTGKSCLMQSASWQPVSATKVLLSSWAPPALNAFTPVQTEKMCQRQRVAFSTNYSQPRSDPPPQTGAGQLGTVKGSSCPRHQPLPGVGTWVLGNTGLGGKAHIYRAVLQWTEEQPCCGIFGAGTDGPRGLTWHPRTWSSGGQFGGPGLGHSVLLVSSRALDPS